MKIYWSPYIDDYVFIDEWYWYSYALSESGKVWYAQSYTNAFELMAEVV